MRTILFTLLALTCMLLSSCNNELDEQQVAITDETNTVFRQSDGILMFDNEAAFLEAVEKVRNNEVGTASFTRSASGEEFISLFREFDQAMTEADDYYQREDDKPETVKRRLDVNIAQGAPIIEHYRKAGIVSDIQGNQEIDAVFADIEKAIAAMK